MTTLNNEISTTSKAGKILLVDDEEIIHLTLNRLLNQEKKYDIDHAYSGKEALEKLNNSYDLIICDVIMAGIDGITILQEVKNKKYKAEVIMLSGFASQKHEMEAKTNNTLYFFHKPIDNITTFKAAVAEAINLATKKE